MGFVCLVYHRVTDDAAARADPFTVRPALLQAQVDWLARWGYRGASLSAAAAASVADPKARVVALTFDDGYADFYEEAWPIVSAAGFGATVCLVSGRLGEEANWPEAMGTPLLATAQVQALAKAGVEIAAHGQQHRALDRLPAAEARKEVVAAREQLATVSGARPRGLAYPYGRSAPWLAAVVAEAGYTWAATARGGRNRAQTPRYALRRTLIRRGDRGLRFALKVWSGYGSLLEARMDLLGVR